MGKAERALIKKKLLAIYRSDADAGIHAAARWLLTQWDEAQQLAAIDQTCHTTPRKLSPENSGHGTWIVNSQGQTLVILDAFAFTMGSPESEDGHIADEALHHRRIDRRYAIAATEVTREQWEAFAKANPTYKPPQERTPNFRVVDEMPIKGITWYEAAWYCNWLSEQDGIPKDQWCYETNDQGKYENGMKAKADILSLSGYRLPTEAEWEFACRAGASSARYYGNSDSLLGQYAWYLVNSDQQMHAVGLLKPNDYGLFDMLGNVYEWCNSEYEPYQSTRASDNTAAVIADTKRYVIRGALISISKMKCAVPPESFTWLLIPTETQAFAW